MKNRLAHDFFFALLCYCKRLHCHKLISSELQFPCLAWLYCLTRCLYFKPPHLIYSTVQWIAWLLPSRRDICGSHHKDLWTRIFEQGSLTVLSSNRKKEVSKTLVMCMTAWNEQEGNVNISLNGSSIERFHYIVHTEWRCCTVCMSCAACSVS